MSGVRSGQTVSKGAETGAHCAEIPRCEAVPACGVADVGLLKEQRLP